MIDNVEPQHHDVMLLDPENARLRFDSSDVTINVVLSHDDWNSVEELILNDAADKERSFWSWRFRQYRSSCEGGSGSWLRAADRAGRTLSTLGVFASNQTARFQHVFTDPSSRGHGYASALIDHAIAMLKAERDVRSFVIAADRGGAAQKLYDRLGFRVVSTQHSLIRSAV